MKIKLMISICLGVIALVAAGAAIAIKKSGDTLPTRVAQAQSKANSSAPSCRTDHTEQFKLSGTAQQSIEQVVIGQLIDVPAGTNVDIRLNTYSPLKITGSEKYDGNFGQYNFTATKSSEAADWRITELTACK